MIDCGEIVHSLAFGMSTSHRFRRWKCQRGSAPVLVLATGHQSGRIKLWNCNTGEFSFLELVMDTQAYLLTFLPRLGLLDEKPLESSKGKHSLSTETKKSVFRGMDKCLGESGH